MLPIHSVRAEFENAVAQNQVVIVIGETGSGKTTQLPQFLYHAGYADFGMIGVTEPRRIATTSMARFVADQLGSTLGELVGYQIRFDATVAPSTAIKFMTDGILLREIQKEPNLSQYSVIMIDEAHERSQNIDFTLGLLKNMLKRRYDLKVIVVSATIEAERFSEYFRGAPIVSIPGRTYPVDIHYKDYDIEMEDEWGRPTMQMMVDEVVRQISSIHRTGQPGDILVFMTGKEDINMVTDQLEESGFNDLITLPAYGGLALEEQDRVFASYPGKRKVVVATNVAETSITIDGIVYVVDCGYIKQSHFHPETGIQSLDMVWHSQAGCEQRAGRAGRTQPGICYRMYSKENFADRPPFTEPEIRRSSLAGVVLAMEDIGIEGIEEFDFLDAPDREAFREAYETLIALGAIAPGKEGITEIGRKMAHLPLEPRIARMLLEAEKYGCVRQIATIAAYLSVNHIFTRPRGKEREADEAHERFKDTRSDTLGYLRIWEEYVALGCDKSWCFKYFLNAQSLSDIQKVRQQLLTVLEQCGMTLSETEDTTVVLRSVTAGLVYNLFEHGSRYEYNGVFRETDMDGFFIHPGSALFGGNSSRWIVAAEVMRTSKSYMRCCTNVELAWLRELLPDHFTEEIQLDRFSENGESMIGRKSILFECRGSKTEVGKEEINLTFDEARIVQEKLIRQAREQDWQLLTFVRSASDKHPSILETEDGLYRTWSYSNAELGATYYCEIKNLGFRYATPKLRVFDIPVDTPDQTVTHAALESLATKWGDSLITK